MNLGAMPWPARNGWHACLDLVFERRASGTVLARNHHRGPLLVQKALHPEGSDVCHVAILHPPGGIAAGDRLHVVGALAAGARAVLTTPGATKWYRSEGEPAHQSVHFRTDEGAVLEWLPRESILFDGSNVSLNLDVALSAESGYFGWEILSFGRRASGERWRRGRLCMRTAVRQGDRLLWSEVADLDAGGRFAQSSMGLAGFTVCGTFVVAGYEIGDELLAACRDHRRPSPGARVGLTRVPSVLLVRYLGDSTEEVFNWFTDLWGLLRPALSGRSACAPRVWAC